MIILSFTISPQYHNKSHYKRLINTTPCITCPHEISNSIPLYTHTTQKMYLSYSNHLHVYDTFLADDKRFLVGAKGRRQHKGRTQYILI